MKIFIISGRLFAGGKLASTNLTGEIVEGDSINFDNSFQFLYCLKITLDTA